jgi:ribA/ribD-fused uncharacterized protein
VTKPIVTFRGQYGFLSNFWAIDLEYEGIVFPTLEHAFQAAKTTSMPVRRAISRLSSPGEAKKMGRGLTLRDDWDNIRLDVMETLLRQKFMPGTSVANALKLTGDAELVEGNNWGDKFWGQSPIGIGHNHLGKLLMKIRSEL